MGVKSLALMAEVSTHRGLSGEIAVSTRESLLRVWSRLTGWGFSRISEAFGRKNQMADVAMISRSHAAYVENGISDLSGVAASVQD
jgi:hypothetical protein